MGEVEEILLAVVDQSLLHSDQNQSINDRENETAIRSASNEPSESRGLLYGTNTIGLLFSIFIFAVVKKEPS